MEEKEIYKKVQETTKQIEANIVGCFYDNSELFYEYNDLKTSSFLNPVWKTYFAIGRKLSTTGIKVFNESDVLILLNKPENARLMKLYEEYGGYGTVEMLSGLFDKGNVDAYIKDLNKWVAFKAIAERFKINSTLFNSMNELDLNQMYDFFNATFNDIFINVTDDVFTSGLDEGLDDIIKEAHEGMEKGMPIPSPILNRTINGVSRGQIMLIGGQSGSGKCQPLDADILTMNGHLKMKDISVGTKVLGEDGKEHSVTGVFPQGLKPMYKITLSDGTSTVSCNEHLWSVQTPWDRWKNKYRTKTLQEIMDEGLYRKSKNGTTTWNWYLPMIKPVEFPTKPVNIDPYVLGVLIGDGGLTDGCVKLSNQESDIIDRVKEKLGNEYKLNLVSENLHDYRIIDNNKNYDRKSKHHNRLTGNLDSLGLMKKNSYDKFIPDLYLYNDVDTRVELLKGLIDTDGEVHNESYTYSTSSPQLSKDIQFLVQSLGGTARISDRQTYYTYDNKKMKGAPSYRIHIKMPRNIKAFSSEKHKANFKIGQTEARRTIRSIEYIGEQEGQCISVDNPSKLYVTNDFIVTHNTTFLINTILTGTWESEMPAVLFINEQSHKKVKTEMMTWIINNKLIKKEDKPFNKVRWRDGHFTDDEMKLIKESKKILEEKRTNNKIILVEFKSYVHATVVRTIKKYAAMGVKMFAIDTFKMSADADPNLPFWLEMQNQMKEFDDLVKPSNLNVALICTLQLGKGAIINRYLSANDIGISKNIIDVCSVALLIRKIHNDEYKDGKNELKIMKPIEGTKSGIEVILDPNKRHSVIFIEKNRNGEAGAEQIVTMHDLGSLRYEEMGITNVPFSM